jgi:molecular chaperone GrpE (heat shock protein)
MNKELLDQFLGLLEASGSFKLLSPEQQAVIKENYKNATDDQLRQAIQVLEEDKVATEKLEAERQKNAEELERNVTKIKTIVREYKRDERKKKEAADDAVSKKEVEGLLKEIDSMEMPQKKEAPKKKEKKFFGIF